MSLNNQIILSALLWFITWNKSIVSYKQPFPSKSYCLPKDGNLKLNSSQLASTPKLRCDNLHVFPQEQIVKVYKNLFLEDLLCNKHVMYSLS